MKRFLGLDIGDKRIGVAISDELNITAQGLNTIKRKNVTEDIINISKIINSKDIEAIIVGIPYRTDSENGRIKSEQGKKIQGFIRELGKQIHIPIIYYDERFTTKESERVLRAAKLKSRKSKYKEIKDKISAQLILQAFLDKK